MNKSVVAVMLLTLTLLAGVAEAGDPVAGRARGAASSQPDPRQPWATSIPTPKNPAFNLQGRQTWATDPKTVFGPQDKGASPHPQRRDWDRNGPHGDHRFRKHPVNQGTVIVAPAPVYVVPTACWVPGYWTYQWIPQVYSYNDWVPGQWTPDGTWVDGHYVARLASTGYWQPYWVEGRDC